jgi:hypothetical protein
MEVDGVIKRSAADPRRIGFDHDILITKRHAEQ